MGYYDVAEKPAVLIFPDEDCSEFPKRFYWSPDGDNGSTYNEEDLVLQDFGETYKTKSYHSKSIMVPPGLTATVYEDANWSGTSESFNGAKIHPP